MRIIKLDGLRGIFSLMIVFFHYPLEYSSSLHFDSYLVRSSYVFVDFFFVLSGFVISYNYRYFDDFSAFSVYLKKRFIRLFPLLFFTSTTFLLVNVIASNHLGDSSNFKKDDLNILFSYLEDICFANSTRFLGNSQGLNIPSWSISAEMISYFVFGLVSLRFIAKWKNSLIIGIILFSLLYYFSGDFYKNNSEFGFLRALIGFHTGYFVLYLSTRISTINVLFEYAIPIVLGIILHYIDVLDGGMKKVLFGVITPFFFGCAILVLLKTRGIVSIVLETRFIQYLGKISFSIYLTHQLILVVVTRVMFRVYSLDVTAINELVIFLMSLMMVLGYSSITYKYVEKKGVHFLKARFLK